MGKCQTCEHLEGTTCKKLRDLSGKRLPSDRRCGDQVDLKENDCVAFRPNQVLNAEGGLAYYASVALPCFKPRKANNPLGSNPMCMTRL